MQSLLRRSRKLSMVSDFRAASEDAGSSCNVKEGSLSLFRIFKCRSVCPRSSDPFYIVVYYIKCVTTSWTYSIMEYNKL